VLTAVLGGTVFAVGFVACEQWVAAPMLPIALFRNRAFTATNIPNLSLIASMYGTLFFLAQYRQTVLHEGPRAAGLRLMPWTATLMVLRPWRASSPAGSGISDCL
jgi:hypothetical protein